MNRSMRLFVVILLTTIGYAAASNAQESNRRDGNWWRQQPQIAQASYMVGFLDGMGLGESFSYWGLPISTKGVDPCVTKAIHSYTTYTNKYLAEVKVGQLVDGLNDFYSDYRNRSITIDNAVWIVANEIGGTPKAQLETMIESFRRNAR